MSVYPTWFAELPDAAQEQAAYASACTGSTDVGTLHRAARQHNWHQSAPAVQAWTEATLAEAKTHCESHRWTDLAPLTAVSERDFELVTHRVVGWIRDPALKGQCLKAKTDPDVLRKLAIQVHDSAKFTKTGLPNALWLGSVPQANGVAAFDADHMHRVVSAFGLWHFGELPPDDAGAVLRIVYRLGSNVPLFKPDWRHGYPGFYFSCAPTVMGSGLARDLQSGELRCKEWIARATDIDPYRDIVSASCVVPAASYNHYELPPAYWNMLAKEIQNANEGAP